MGRELELALEAQGGILACDSMKELMQEKFNLLFEEQ